MRDLNKFKGCLIGGAIGDALGYAVEFMPVSAIWGKYGENCIRVNALKAVPLDRAVQTTTRYAGAHRKKCKKFSSLVE